MKIVIATPLYPPEIEGSATYVKELAKRLVQNHEVAIVTYGRLPEEIQGVEIVTVDKHHRLFIRLISFTSALWRAVRGADVLYVQNGASVELPAILVSLARTMEIFVGMSDIRAKQITQKSTVLSLIEHIMTKRARSIITDLPLSRPKLISFEDYPTQDMETYERSWKTHINNLNMTFDHAK